MNDMELKRQKDYMRAKVFFQEKIPVHICLKSGSFYNGLILEEPSTEFFFIEDKEDGRKLIFYIELIKPIDEFKEKK